MRSGTRQSHVVWRLGHLVGLAMLFPCCLGLGTQTLNSRSISLRERIARLGDNIKVAASTVEALSAFGRDNPKPVTPGQLIIIRHGQSAWNFENRFTGWANVDLSEKGEEEALEAADILLDESELQIDVCYTSVLKRAVRTADIVLDRWQACGRERPPSLSRWRLNERHYGTLTGQNKRQALQDFDASQLREWRASFDGKPPPMEESHSHYSRTEARHKLLLDADSPSDEALQLTDVPLTESLADTRERVRPLWEDELKPTLLEGKNVLIVGHANCLRALISCIQPGLSDVHLPTLGLPNALPLMYTFDASGAPTVDPSNRCYINPLSANYLGDACVLFNEMDLDGNGALDAAELDDSEFCQVVYDGYDDLSAGEGGEGGSCGTDLLGEADNNNDGLVDFNEYMNWWAKLPERGRGTGGGGAGAGRIRGWEL